MSRYLPVLSVLLLAAGCRTEPTKPDDTGLNEDCTWYADADGDGYGDPGVTASGPCSGVGEGYVRDGFDCDDTDPAVHPGAEEICNGLDDDCDGTVDVGVVDAPTWYIDGDGDGYGDPDLGITACEQPEGYIDTDGDCDDGDAAVHPGAAERCNGEDDDCDGEVDEDVQETWYADVDGDGYGDAALPVESCDPGEGWVEDATDCDDGDPAVFPGAEEVCNEVDDDCDGEVDEDLGGTWYRDADSDGYGDPANEAVGCAPDEGWVEDASDCDDHSSAIHPAADERCNGYDDDCDGLIDDDDPSLVDALTWYEDADADNYGDDSVAIQACEEPSGFVALGGDCDDEDPAFNPGATEDDCTDPNDYNCDGSTGYTDDDGDGWAACEECDDGDAAIYPGADEWCDGVDDDCDGLVDEDDALDAATWYADADGDGYGDAASTDVACSAPSGFVADDTDCDDADAGVNPAAAEVCDGVDQDCDGVVDDGVLDTFWADADGDGYGDAASPTEACSAPSGFVADDTDCDDVDAGVYPGADEHCDGVDEDCDGYVDEAGAVDEPTWYADGDGDGYGNPAAGTRACTAPSGTVADDTDCDDTDAGVYPGADEHCDGVDEDCDGLVDEDAVDALTWYADVDGDGYGDAADSVTDCTAPTGYGADDTDCDDGDAGVYPGADEHCDGVDEDCDGVVDEGATDALTWYADADGDGYGDAGDTATACAAPTGYGADATDCDDTDAGVYPGADEHCDGVDEDCDGTVDEGAVDAPTWYADADGDGYGDAADSVTDCAASTGYGADDTDCDDTDAGVYPGADEHCDGVDEDCDGTVDEGAVDVVTWYADADGDGYGDPSTTATACTAPSGYGSDASDCDDSAAAVNPGATEVCNGYDDDCDALVDDADPGVTGTATWYADADRDGYGNPLITTTACSLPSGFVANSSDCDDGAAAVNPAATEVCNGYDDDCDALVDDADPGVTGTATWYADADGDGYGDVSSTAHACTAPSGYGSDHSDCDDTAAAVHPGATEVCNGYDDDCDALVDDADPGVTGTATWYADADGDGYGNPLVTTAACSLPSGFVADGSDCDDGVAAVNPAATEVCNGYDDDCDSLVDDADPSVTGTATWYADADADGYGDAGATAAACSAPSGYGSDHTDCDDTDAAVYPGAPEHCDGVDEDCDGTADEGAVDALTWYADADGDGYGDPAATATACTAPPGYGSDARDCDDSAAAVNPGATEVCNGYDDDCDALVDDADPSVTGTATWYADADADGYGDAGATASACTAPSGYGSDHTDCDDTDAAVYPGATEHCDGVDEDCDGTADEGAVDALTWYADTDGDGYGDPAATATACTAPSGYGSDARDCDDTDPAVSPAGSEVCNGYDDDCDGLVDDDDSSVTGTSTWYQDYDLDGYGDASVTTTACDEPSGYTNDATDCDDGDPDINPAASEVCDGLDDDCDGAIDEGSVCPCAVETWGGHAYMFCTTLTSWTDAQAECWSYDYHMLTIDDATEDDWANATADTYSTLKWWFGFNDQASEGTWVWEDSSAVSYTNWESGEPNDSGGDEDCAQLNRFHPANTWNDEPCTSAFQFICEAD